MRNLRPGFSKNLLFAIIPLIIVSFFISNLSIIKGANLAEGDLKILKKEVTSIAKFYPYKSGSTYMEVIAVRASDGSVRTALNTCQVCFDSGRGYYTQQKDELVCYNCGNRFQINQIEKIKYGCNPIPITSEYKKDDGNYVTISRDFLAKNAVFFKR